MTRMTRPIRSWLALVERINAPLDSDDGNWLARMREKLAEGWALTNGEADRIEKLRDRYGESA